MPIRPAICDMFVI